MVGNTNIGLSYVDQSSKKIAKRINVLKQEYFHSDFIILSYPKSGRTWIRNLLGDYMHCIYGVKITKKLNNADYNRVIDRVKKDCPLISLTHDWHSILGETQYKNFYKIFDSQNNFLFEEFYKTDKTLILLRDPIDCSISYYWMLHKAIEKFSGSIEEWFDSSEFGIENLIKFFNNLLELKNKKNLLTIHYQNLFYNDAWIKILEYFKMPIDKKLLEQLLQKYSFNNMKQKEMQEKMISNPNSNKLFVRQGGKNYIRYLSDYTKNKIESNKKLVEIIKCVEYMV